MTNPSDNLLERRWTPRGNWPYFRIERVGAGSDQHDTPNATYATKQEALLSLIGSLEDTRRELNAEIAKHKRALSRMRDARGGEQ